MIAGWRLPLRIARRDALRAKGRSILMLVMIALPVMGVTAADVLIQTQDVSSVESLDRRLGTEAAAKVSYGGERVGRQEQGLDPDSGASGGDVGSMPPPTLATVLAALGGERRGIEVGGSYLSVKTDKGSVEAGGTEVDLEDPLARGLFRLEDGRWPRNADEVVVNAALAQRGPGLGERIRFKIDKSLGGSGTEVERVVVGIAESASVKDWGQVAGPRGSVPLPVRPDASERYWLIGGGPVTWDDVLKLNALGALVVSRSVISDPSPAALAADRALTGESGIDDATVTVAILVVVMALIEVVLLAGPAFAVGARRQARPLALIAASGGTPQQARRVVLATGLVIGTAGAIGGVVLGIAGAAALNPILQRSNGSWFGPFEVPWPHLLGVALFGLISALVAAVVPAWIASRQDVVAVLAGRRGDRRPSARSPFIGVALVGAGIALAALGAGQRQTTSASFIALSAICCVLGMLFLVPVVVVGFARLGRRLPLALRFAVRDAARHRTRTTPAVAAVAATVMGVIAFGIGTSSDEARNEATYVPSLPMGSASVGADDGSGDPVAWGPYVDAVAAELPDARIDQVRGIPYVGPGGISTSIGFTGPDDTPLLSSFSSNLGSGVYVYDGDLPEFIAAIDGFDAAAAEKTLAAGGAVVFADDDRPVRAVDITVESYDQNGMTDEETTAGEKNVPAIAFDLRGRAPGTGIIPRAMAKRLGLGVTTVGLVVNGATISKAQQKDIDERLNSLSPSGFLYVERGYQTPPDIWLVQLVLGGLGAILMLGGTLTATFLALSDARPDLATLSAVGAAPRVRRGVAAAYALAVGGIGALLGVVIGFVPGIAVTYPLTSQGWQTCSAQSCFSSSDFQPDHYLAVPWLLIGGVVVLLPLLCAAIVWVFARSRLPLVARLS
ncbi:FtsX-like permease family protein [Nocardioides marmoriginsengisoli]|uniref:FtsX-like permease family protein n=1 Tax=Nocardioides marmoriginsengisoli TaxID=661483 RepID=A0A3N0CP90_9ACTN|nr:FtsX-like permease family protein [Nocardioides marmoriginsengisoli]RNL65265.1 FtsX-like permease family protein [Nocardioides marmoriginsengisoli]